MTEQKFWRNCSSCKKEISFNSKYFECNVSSCQGKRTGYVFCSVFCWERHLPGAKHRDAAAIEMISPSLQAWLKESQSTPADSAPKRIIVGAGSSNSAGVSQQSSSMENEVLVVVSKMKTYIKDRADMNTSGDVADVLSVMIRKVCDLAINNARADGRKTVMGKDFK